MDEEQIAAAAEEKMQEIEGEFPPGRCTLDEYRLFLLALGEEIQERVAQLVEEIG